MHRNMELIFFVLLFISSIGIHDPFTAWGHFQLLKCINNTSVIRCEDGLVVTIDENLKTTCGESRDDRTPCLLEYIENTCNNKSFCQYRENEEHSCPTSDKNVTCTNHRYVSRCGLNFTCNETKEVCSYKNNENDSTCKCAKNYHEKYKNVCSLGQHIRCDRGVLDMKENRERIRPTLTAFRSGQKIQIKAPCSSPGELDEMKARCNNRQSCEIRDKKSTAPCMSYLTYDCVPRCGFNDGCNRTTEVCVDMENDIRCKCAENYHNNSDGYCTANNVTNGQLTQCTNENTFFHCESGVIIIEPTQNDERPNITVECGQSAIKDYRVPCLSKDELANMKAECDNKTHCKIPPKRTEIRPCDGYFNYKCVSTCALYDPCNKTSEVCLDSENGTKCRCAENYDRNSDDVCTASTCALHDPCNKTSEVCLDSENGTKCRCAENYDRNIDGVCTEITPSCPFDVQYVEGIIITFNKTLIGQVAYSQEFCPPKSSYPNRSLASRKCNDQGWEELTLVTCYTEDKLNSQLEDISQVNVTDENVEEVAGVLVLASGQTDHLTNDGVESLITSLDSVVHVGNPSPEVTDCVVGVVSNVMAIDDSTLDDTENVNSIVSLLENQVASVLQSGQNYSDLTEQLEVNAVLIERSSLQNNYTFHSQLKGNTADNDSGGEGHKKSSILLPASLLQIINEGVGIVPISLISYQDDSLFRTSPNDSKNARIVEESIDSHVISATVELQNVTVKDLPSNSTILTRFSYPKKVIDLNETNITVEISCVYWDIKELKWSQEGCRKLSSEEEEGIVCSCDHLTSFAVLVRMSQQKHDVTKETPFYRDVLSIASKVGCIICIISLSCCVIALLIVRPVRQKQQTHVHLNLCVALLGFYLAFLLGIDKVQHPTLCEAMTSLIYFFCLSSMAWMSVEAFYIYMLIWKFKRSGIRHFMSMAASFAWGLPAFGSVLVYFLEEPHDYVNEPDYCFLRPGVVFRFGFVLEIGILLFYNITVFSLVTYRVGFRRIYFSKKEERRAEIMTRVKSTFLFWILLGISWIFAFLSIMQNPSSLVFETIFCICLSLQGFVMLYMLILQNPEMIKSLRPKRKPAPSSVTMVSGMKNVYVVRKDSVKGSTLRMQSNPLSSTTDCCDYY